MKKKKTLLVFCLSEYMEAISQRIQIIQKYNQNR